MLVVRPRRVERHRMPQALGVAAVCSGRLQAMVRREVVGIGSRLQQANSTGGVTISAVGPNVNHNMV